ncbi:MAG: LysR family transcriptional regulator [Peptococcaceae bacterium]|jgi:DNA-binding transcriptional LysR family regulator|nr:LysR family transcriptional regulator [Peptococcaceae bacterium]
MRSLEIFVKVADKGSMTAAAEALFITQPTVSQAISELERHYGTKLFDRLGKKLYITESGKRLLDYARHIIALQDEMELAMTDPEKKGMLRIGASVTIGTELLPGLVKIFQEKHRELRIHGVVKNTSDIENLIQSNEIDFALVEGTVNSKNIVVEPFMDDDVVLVCGRNHPLYGSKSVQLEELLKYDFLVREHGSGTRELFASTMLLKNAVWNMIWECSGSDGIKAAAACGIGIGVLSHRLIEKEMCNGELSILNVPGLKLNRKFSIIYHKNKYITDRMKEFFRLAKGCQGDGVVDTYL